MTESQCPSGLHIKQCRFFENMIDFAQRRPHMEGSFSKIPLENLIQILGIGEPCQLLCVEGYQPTGIIMIAHGKIIQARTPEKQGEEAFRAIWGRRQHGGFRVYSLPPQVIQKWSRWVISGRYF